MIIIKLNISSVRNIIIAAVYPSPTLNFIVGKNASGKSAFLEAIFLLGRIKSFRSTAIKSVINSSQLELVVSAEILQINGATAHLGVQIDSKNYYCRINHQTTHKKSDFAYALPLQVIHPKSYELLDAAPQLRREFLDWGVFNDNESFLLTWRNYKKALAHRNSLLKTRSLKQLNVWNNELVYYGTMVNNYRQSYLLKFKPVFIEIVAKFLDLNDVDLRFLSGWNTDKELAFIFTEDLDKDLRFGFTHSGPHRGDIQIVVDGRLAKDFVSRGQLKLLVMSLKLAQMQLLKNQHSNVGCFLIDDFAAELDLINRAKLLQYLIELECQVFITTTEPSDFGDLSHIENYKMFHVEQGNIIQV